MAFQIDLPILILRESGVLADGILEKGSSAFYLPTFDLDTSAQSYLYSHEWQHIFHKWSRQVKELAKARCISSSADEPPPIWPFLRNRENETVMKIRTSPVPERQGRASTRETHQPWPRQSKARANWDFRSAEDSELSFREGRIMSRMRIANKMLTLCRRHLDDPGEA